MESRASDSLTRPTKSHWPAPTRRPMAFYIERARQARGLSNLFRRTFTKGRTFWASLAAAILLLFAGGTHAIAAGSSDQVCDVAADYPLGLEDYAQAIRLHEDLIRRQPRNALAHYHLGFALGMVGDRAAEVREYQRAAALGLNNWDLFLNLGMAQLEDGDLDSATASLRRAVLLGASHPESHFNLALVEVQRGMLPEAEREILLSLRLSPPQPDARNLLGVIYAQQGNSAKAALVWRELLADAPDYQPARTNLSLLSSQSGSAPTETAAVPLLPTAAVQPPNEPKPTSLKSDTEPAPASVEKIGGQIAWAR
jgi:Flp pilus assembly protein TadD